MNINHTKMTLEINSCKNYEILEVRQGDKGSRIIDFAFTVNGEIVDLASTMSAKVNATVDDVIVAEDVAAVVDTENNVVTVTLTDTMLALSGICKMDIVLTEGNEIITAETVCLRVGKKVINGDSKPYVGASSITELMKEIATARGSSNSLGARLDTVDTNLTKKANKSDIDSINSRLQSAETTLKNKANIADMSNSLASKANKSTTLAGYGITDGLKNVAGSVTTDNIVNKAVTTEKLSDDVTNQLSKLKDDIADLSINTLIEPVNVLNYNAVSENTVLHSYDGETAKKTGYKVSDFIPATFGESLSLFNSNYSRNMFNIICEYDENKKYITGATEKSGDYVINSENCKYIRFCRDDNMTSEWQVIKNGYIPNQKYEYFIPYYKYIQGGFVIPEQFGAVGNGVFDDADSIQRCINFAQTNNKNVMLLATSVYYISKILKISAPLNFNGNNATIKCGVSTGIVVSDLYRNDSGIVENLTINLNYTATKGIYIQHSFGKIYRNIVLKYPAENGWGIYIQRPSGDTDVTSGDNVFKSIRGIGNKQAVNGFIYCNGPDNNFYDLLYQNMNYGFRNSGVGGTTINGLRGWVAGQSDINDYGVNYRGSYLLYNSGTVLASNLFADTICTPLYLTRDHTTLINGFEEIFNSNFSNLLPYADNKNYIVYIEGSGTLNKICLIGILLRNKVGDSGYYIDFSNVNLPNVIGKINAF